MAKERVVDIKTAIRGEPDRFYQCFRLIEELEHQRQTLDFGKICRNLGNYPTIKSFLGKEWFKRKRMENNKTHPLLIGLSHEIPRKEEIKKDIEESKKETDSWLQYLKSLRVEEMLWPIAFLNHLEKMLKVIMSKGNKLGDLKDGLRNEDQFWQTVSEIEVISSFMGQYHVEIAPEIEGKKLDARVKIDGEEFLVEVISPEMFKPLRHLTGKALGIENRARGKIYDEFKKHLRDVHLEENVPIIIVIDIARSEISYEFVEDYLIGTLQLVFRFDKKNGKVVKTYPTRAENSMHALKEETDVLSAVLCYKRFMGKGDAFHFEGRIILNQYAKNKLSPNLIEQIEKTMFGNLK